MFDTDPPAVALRDPSRSLSHLLTGWQLGATRLPFLIPHQTPASAPAAPRVTAQVAREGQGEAFCAAGRDVLFFFIYFFIFPAVWSHHLFSARWKCSRYIYINTLWLVVKADKVAKKPLTSQQLLLQTHLLHVAARMRLRSLSNLPQGK